MPPLQKVTSWRASTVVVAMSDHLLKVRAPPSRQSRRVSSPPFCSQDHGIRRAVHANRAAEETYALLFPAILPRLALAACRLLSIGVRREAFIGPAYKYR